MEAAVQAQHAWVRPLTAAPANVTIRYLPSGKVVPQNRIPAADMTLIIGSARLFQVMVDREADALPAQGDGTYEIQVANFRFNTPGSSPITLKATGTSYD